MSRKNPRIMREIRHQRVRKVVVGTPERPRLSVFRSLAHIYAQIIDDSKSATLVAAGSGDDAVKGQGKDKKKTLLAKEVGALLARRALEKGISQVVFDRGGFKYHGRVKSLADAAREGGLKF